MRKFEIVNKRTSSVDIKMPQRATKYSAGYDFYSPTNYVLQPNEMKLIFSDIKAQMESDDVLILCTTSGMGKKGIVLANSIGVIDADYYNNVNNEGNIGFMLKNTSQAQYEIKVGDKIGQGIFVKYLTVEDENVVDKERVGGFGSTVTTN